MSGRRAPTDPEPLLDLPPEVAEVRRHLPTGAQAWLVGGAVRDLLLGRPLQDFDLAVPARGLAIARRLADSLGAAFVPLDAERGVARVVWRRDRRTLELDVADFRAPDLSGDLTARDFTINAMAVPLSGEPRLIDPAGGREDLERGVVRLISRQALRDDPLRGLRAVRFAAQLGFTVDGTTGSWVREEAAGLRQVAGERVRDELFKALAAPGPPQGRGPGPTAAVRLLDGLGLLPHTLPELVALQELDQSAPHSEDVWEHTLSVLTRLAEVLSHLAGAEAADDEAWRPVASALAPFREPLAARVARQLAGDRPARGLLLLAALLHDAGKATTRSLGEDGRIHFYRHEEAGAAMAEARLQALRFAQAEVQHVAGIVRHHMRPLALNRPQPLSDRSLHRFHRATGDVAPEVCLLALADNLAKGEGRAHGDWPGFVARVGELLEAFFERHGEVVSPTPLLRGGELVRELGMVVGPAIGELLRALVEAQAAGEVRDRAEALVFAHRWRAQRGS